MEDSLKVWMNGLSNKADGTRALYNHHFMKFCVWSGRSADELRLMKWKEDQANRPWERNTVENLVRRYLHDMEGSQGLACETAKSAYTSIKSFFRKNGVPLNLDSNDQPGGENLGGSAVPTKEQIQTLYNAVHSLRDRALVLFLKDSGLRSSDVCRLKWKDLTEQKHGFYGFEIVTKKRKVKAHGFIGPETSKILMLYRNERIKGTNKIPPEQNIEDHYIFCLHGKPEKPMISIRVSDNLGAVIEKLDFEVKITPHGLRKFWEQNMHAEREAYIKQLNGRKLTLVEKAYLERNPTDLFKVYLTNYDNLRVLEQPAIRQDDIEEIIKRRVQERSEAQQREIEKLKTQLGPLMEFIDKFENKEVLAQAMLHLGKSLVEEIRKPQDKFVIEFKKVSPEELKKKGKNI